MSSLVDLTGQRFGRLVVIEQAERDKRGQVLWTCQCDCGSQCVVLGVSLRSEKTKSCGCFQRESARDNGKDITGQRFGRLVVIGRAGHSKNRRVLWNCQCDCGQRRVVAGVSLRRGDTKSCGCLSREITGDVHRKHGKSRTPLYTVWKGMMTRCGLMGKPNKQEVKNYVNRGITVCEEWRVFENFERWALANGYAKGLELDRRDNDKGYCPENCHFVTDKQNTRNRRRSWKLPSGEHIYDFCERWINRQLSKSEYGKIGRCWQNHKRLPNFVFEAMRNRAIADLDAAHKQTEVEI